MRWLTDPELMTRWILGAERVEVRGDRLRLTMATRLGRQQVVNVFDGEILARDSRRLVRRYTLEGELAYTRTVTYELAPSLEGCTLNCMIVTDVEGLPDKVIRAGVKGERRSLPSSLNRLRLGVEARRLGLWRRYRDKQLQPQPL